MTDVEATDAPTGDPAAGHDDAATAAPEMAVPSPAKGAAKTADKAAGKSAPAAGSKTVPAAEATTWRDGISDPDVRKFAERFDTPAALAKAGLDFRRQISTMVKVPGKDATEEDIAAFRKHLGVPETVDAYEVKIPDDLPDRVKAGLTSDAGQERLNGFLQEMHETGVPKAAAQRILDSYYKMAAADIEAQEQAAERAAQLADQAIRKTWGADYEANNTAANAAFRQFSNEDLRADLGNYVYVGPDPDRAGLRANADPAMLSMFANVGRSMTEDQFQASQSPTVRASLQEQLDETTAKLHAAYQSNNPVEIRRLNAEQTRLTTQLYGDGPIVGSQGRSI